MFKAAELLGYAVHIHPIIIRPITLGRRMKLKFLLLLLLSGSGMAAVALQSSSGQNFIAEKDVACTHAGRNHFARRCPAAPGKGTFPVLVYRTPYGKEFALKEYTTFQHAVERGYAVVVQDVRGRYASAGEFRPYENEGRDGYDTIEWAAHQPWSNGAIGTFGLSYPGAVQWLAAVENPPHLKAMVPAMTFSSAQNFFYAGGLWDLSWIEWIWDNIAPDVRTKNNLPGPKTPDEAVAAWGEAGAEDAGRAAAERGSGAARHRSLLLRLVEASFRRSLVGLVRFAQQIFSRTRGSAEFFRLVRRQLRTRRGYHELRGIVEVACGRD